MRWHSTIGGSRQAVVYFDYGHHPILPKARFGRGRTLGIAMPENFFIAFTLNVSAMISLYLNISDGGCRLFFCAIILVIMSMILFTLEIQIANSALDVHLSDLEKHQEWKDYIEKKSRRKSASKASSDQSPS